MQIITIFYFRIIVNNNNNRRLVTLAEHTSDHGTRIIVIIWLLLINAAFSSSIYNTYLQGYTFKFDNNNALCLYSVWPTLHSPR